MIIDKTSPILSTLLLDLNEYVPDESDVEFNNKCRDIYEKLIKTGYGIVIRPSNDRVGIPLDTIVKIIIIREAYLDFKYNFRRIRIMCSVSFTNPNDSIRKVPLDALEPCSEELFINQKTISENRWNIIKMNNRFKKPEYIFNYKYY